MTDPLAPGWYPDPWGTAKHRWFDGEAWTQQVFPPDVTAEPDVAQVPATPVGGGDGAPTWMPQRHPHAQFDRESRLGRILAAVMPFAGFAVVATSVSSLAVMRWLADNWDEFMTAAEAGRTVEPVLPGWVSLLSWVGQFPLLVIQIMFLVWCYRAARLGADLGIPARRSPGWAVGSWIIPILNFWWPYQSVADAVPPGDPSREIIRHWWTLWIVMTLSSFVVLATAFAPMAVSIAVVLVHAVLALAAAYAARRMLTTVVAVHEAVVRG